MRSTTCAKAAVRIHDLRMTGSKRSRGTSKRSRPTSHSLCRLLRPHLDGHGSESCRIGAQISLLARTRGVRDLRTPKA